jgi:hypothetical protein
MGVPVFLVLQNAAPVFSSIIDLFGIHPWSIGYVDLIYQIGDSPSRHEEYNLNSREKYAVRDLEVPCSIAN